MTTSEGGDSKVKGFFRGLYKAISSPIGLMVILIAYTFGGAFMFQSVEGPHETIEKHDILEMREEIIQNLWNSSHRKSAKELKFAAVVAEELKRYEAQLYSAFAHGINTDSNDTVWDLWGAMLFCTTVYTTVGYGHIAPATNAGRILTMIYGLIGIPLCLIVLAELGKFFTLFLKFLWSFIRRFFHTGQCKKVRKTVAVKKLTEAIEKVESKIRKTGEAAATSESLETIEVEEEVEYEVDDDFNLPPLVAIVITVIYIFAGATMYMQWEVDWDYLDAFYFIFISISTVGFGDVLPGNKKFFLLSFIYQLFGLALVAMVINVIMEVVQHTITTAKDKVAFITTSVGKKIGIPLGMIEESEQKKMA